MKVTALEAQTATLKVLSLDSILQSIFTNILTEAERGYCRINFLRIRNVYLNITPPMYKKMFDENFQPELKAALEELGYKIDAGKDFLEISWNEINRTESRIPASRRRP